jgi:hypothetical protein
LVMFERKFKYQQGNTILQWLIYWLSLTHPQSNQYCMSFDGLHLDGDLELVQKVQSYYSKKFNPIIPKSSILLFFHPWHLVCDGYWSVVI